MRFPMTVGRGRFRRGDRSFRRHEEGPLLFTAQCRAAGLYARHERIG
jgi:hypothetical protein